MITKTIHVLGRALTEGADGIIIPAPRDGREIFWGTAAGDTPDPPDPPPEGIYTLTGAQTETIPLPQIAGVKIGFDLTMNGATLPEDGPPNIQLLYAVDETAHHLVPLLATLRRAAAGAWYLAVQTRYDEHSPKPWQGKPYDRVSFPPLPSRFTQLSASVEVHSFMWTVDIRVSSAETRPGYSRSVEIPAEAYNTAQTELTMGAKAGRSEGPLPAGAVLTVAVSGPEATP